MNLSEVQQALPEYEIEEELGPGCLSVAYLARRKSDGQRVSIKIVSPEWAVDPVFVRRFLEAAGRAMRLDHSNIARVYEADQRGSVVYMVRQYVEAENLVELMERVGSLSPTHASTIIRQLASALDHAHSRRLMHGDINGRCVYVESSGHVVLTDFGLAQAVAGHRRLKGSLGNIKTLVGVENAGFLAPERVQGQGATRAADIYALGVVAFWLLAGEMPFSGEQEAILEAHVYKNPPALQGVNRAVSSALAAAVARALSKKPELRYNTAMEFSRAFLAAAEGIAPQGMTAPHLPVQAPRRRGIPTALAVVLALTLGLLLAYSLWNLAGWGDRFADRLDGLFPSPGSETAVATSTPQAGLIPINDVPTPVTPSPSPVPTDTATVEPMPTESPATATVAAAPTAAQGSVITGSPFTNLVLSRGIDEAFKPVFPGDAFDAGDDPVYLFFSYRGITAGTPWGHVWLRGDQELGRTEETWPDDWGEAGTAWVFYVPEDDFQPGSYSVQLLVNGQVVATAGFTIR